MAQLTTNELRAKWSGKNRWLSDSGTRGAGRLLARLTRGGVFFYFQYYLADGQRRQLPLGRFDSQGEHGLSLAGARERTAELSKLYRSGVTDIHAHLEQQRTLIAQQQAQAALARQVEQMAAAEAVGHAERRSLRKFLTAYVEHLQGKPSAKDIANIFKNHVFTDAALSERDATLISTDDFVGLISKVVAAGHGRTGAKLRSYLRAAYALAIRAKTNPAAPQSMRDFDIQINPVASIDALAQFNRALKRNLSAPELAAFLKRVRSLPIDAKRDALEVCICLGGQRPTQLLRLRRADVDLSAGVITLYDPKGRRQHPRPHLVPVPKLAADILQRRTANLTGDEPVFSTDGGSVMDRGTLTNFVTAIAVEMVKSGESREQFTLRDLRRTLETLLASWGVSSDARKHLQSHGLGGVQQRHYDQYEYLREKRAALRTLSLRLDRVLARNAARESN
jgi:integrase